MHEELRYEAPGEFMQSLLPWDFEIISWSLTSLIGITHFLPKNKGNGLPDLLFWSSPAVLRITCICLKFSVVLNGCIHRMGFNFFPSLREQEKVESSAFIYTYNLSFTLHRTMVFKEKYFSSNVDKIEYSWQIWIQAIDEMSAFLSVHQL